MNSAKGGNASRSHRTNSPLVVHPRNVYAQFFAPHPCDEHRYLLDSETVSERERGDIRRILLREGAEQDIQDSLLLLSEALYQHHGERVVILIDEYDTPIQAGYTNDFFDDVVGFFRNFSSAGLKEVLFGKETLDQALVKAAKQVCDRRYAAELVAAGASPVYEYATVFDGKQAWVKRVEDVLATPAT